VKRLLEPGELCDASGQPITLCVELGQRRLEGLDALLHFHEFNRDLLLPGMEPRGLVRCSSQLLALFECGLVRSLLLTARLRNLLSVSPEHGLRFSKAFTGSRDGGRSLLKLFLCGLYAGRQLMPFPLQGQQLCLGLAGPPAHGPARLHGLSIECHQQCSARPLTQEHARRTEIACDKRVSEQ